MSDFSVLSNDLKQAYAKSLNIALELTRNKEFIYKAPCNAKEMRLARHIERARREFRDLYDLYIHKTPEKKKISLEALKSVAKSPKEPVPKFDRLEGKNMLRYSLKEVNKEIKRVQAGGFHRGKYMNKLSQSPPLIQRIEKQGSVSPSPRLPNLSLVTGKTKPSLELPSFRDFSHTSNISYKKKANASPFDKLNDMIAALDSLPKKLTGLEIFIQDNPGVSWEYNENVLLKLGANPLNKANIIKWYNDKYIHGQRRHTLNLKNRENTERAKTAMGQYSPAKDRVQECSDTFKYAQNDQNSKLKKILEKFEQERPIMLKKKLEMVSGDTGRYKDPIHSLHKFEAFTKAANTDRILRIRQANKQISVYRELLLSLKNREDNPKQTELLFADALKDILETGWPIDTDALRSIVLTFKYSEREVIAPLVALVCKHLRVPISDIDFINLSF